MPKKDTNSKPDNISKSRYAVISLIGLLISILLAYYYFSNPSQMLSGNNQEKAYYILLVVFAVSVNAFLFGAMASYAAFTGSAPGKTIKLSGPLVGVCLIVAGGFILPAMGNGNTLSIRVYDEKHEPVKTGQVRLNLKSIMQQPINANGEAVFTDVTGKADSFTAEIISDGFEKDIFVIKTAGNFTTIERTLARKTKITIEGNITDADYRPIVNAIITADGTPYSANTLSDGRYKLEVNNVKIGEDIVLSVFHPNYASKEIRVKVVAEVTVKDVILSLPI